MSTTLLYYVKIVAVSSVDLLLGYGIGYLVNKWFQQNTKLSPTDTEGERARAELVFSCAQAAVTVLVADEARSLIYPKGFEDPTGGVVFMNSLFLKQTTLWDRVTSFWQYLDSEYQKYMGGENSGVRVDDAVTNEQNVDTERPAESERSGRNRLGQVAQRDAHLTPGISSSSLYPRGSSNSTFDTQ